MASPRSVANTLAYLHELYPTREVSPVTLEAFSIAFGAWSDDELRDAAMQAATTPGRTFFPTPGEISACRKVSPIVDAAKLLRQVEKLGGYTGEVGYIAPQVETVRLALGDVVADAYATAGSFRCFSADEITRSIAYREFQKAATEYAALPPGQRPLLESGAGPRRIAPRNAPSESISAIVTRALPVGVPQ